MNDLYMFFTGGSGNRGCEAIVRGTDKLLDNYNKIVFTAHMDEDISSGLTNKVQCIDIKNRDNFIKEKLEHILCYFSYHLGNGKLQTKLIYKRALGLMKNSKLYLVIGGDVYCYGKPYMYYHINKIMKNSPKILWGCSIEPNSIDDEMRTDLLLYDMIYARESITYNALIKNGIDKNTVLYPDPAFCMDKIEMKLPDGFIEGNTIGINVSPLVINCVKDGDVVLKNYEKLIEYIIDNTGCQIAMIPHVIWSNNDDRIPLKSLYEKYKDTGRVVMLDGEPSEKIKGYISRCRFLIAARTHASIAAYSTCVPTLVVGYSVKARGIAKDIFGEYEHYTIPVQELNKENDLTESFKWMWEREEQIKQHLLEFMPKYIGKLKELPKMVDKILK